MTDFNAQGETPSDECKCARNRRAAHLRFLIRRLDDLHALTNRRLTTPTLRSEHQGLQLMWADVLMDWSQLEVDPVTFARPEWDLRSRWSTRATTRPERWRRSVIRNAEEACDYALRGAYAYDAVKATLSDIRWGYIELTSDVAGWVRFSSKR